MRVESSSHFPQIDRSRLAAAYREGKYVVVMVNNDGGPTCSDWKSDKLSDAERLGRKIRSAIPSRNLCLDVGEEASNGGFRLVAGFKAEERGIKGPYDGPIGFGLLPALGEASGYYDVVKVSLSHEITVDFIDRFNRGLGLSREEPAGIFARATEALDREISMSCKNWGAAVWLTHDVVMMSYLAAHDKDLKNVRSEDWPRYLDALAVIYDHDFGRVTECGFVDLLTQKDGGGIMS